METTTAPLPSQQENYLPRSLIPILVFQLFRLDKHLFSSIGMLVFQTGNDCDCASRAGLNRGDGSSCQVALTLDYSRRAVCRCLHAALLWGMSQLYLQWSAGENKDLFSKVLHDHSGCLPVAVYVQTFSAMPSTAIVSLL